MIFESLSISFTKNIHLKCNLKATEFSSFAFDNYSLIYIQVFFFSKNYQNEFLWVLWAKFEISSEIFFSFDDAILEIIGFEAELHHQKICFPQITSGCKDTNHFDTIMKAIGNLTEIEK